MKLIQAFILSLVFIGVATPSLAGNNDLKAVKAFYNDLLSNPNGENLDQRVRDVVVEQWVSIPTPRGGKDAQGLADTLRGFGAAIPNLKWEIQEILQDGNRYIVRSIATGTPVKPVFGIEPKGNSFKIMTIDIHTVESGKIVSSYHVEEWAKAMKQLSAKKETEKKS